MPSTDEAAYEGTQKPGLGDARHSRVGQHPGLVCTSQLIEPRLVLGGADVEFLAELDRQAQSILQDSTD